MATANDIQAIKTRCAQLQQAADRAAGALDQTMARLKDEHGCATIEAAEALLKKLRADEAKLQQAFDTTLAAFRRDWREQLGPDET